MSAAADILSEATHLVDGPRREAWGDPKVSFGRIAQLWTPIVGEIEPWQVALCLAQLKVARALESPLSRDSWVDLAGYAALGAEVAGDVS